VIVGYLADLSNYKDSVFMICFKM